MSSTALTDFADLLKTEDVQKLRALFHKMSPNVRQAFFRKYFCPVLSTPNANPKWLETDADTYTAQLRQNAYGIEE